MLEQNQIYLGDCLELMKEIYDKSLDLILCDLPYGTTNRNKWDEIIPFDLLWEQYERVIKDNGAILLFSDEPFTSKLICSNLKRFKQRITWDKDKGCGFLNAKKMLLKQTEDICLFYKKPPTYNPQMVVAKESSKNRHKYKYNFDDCTKSLNYGEINEIKYDKNFNSELSYPTNLIKISCWKNDVSPSKRLHPTQKPIKLLEWLIKTYSNEGDLILDNCMGSGSTIVACKNTDRNYIGIEKDEHYYNIAYNRINGYIYE